MVPEVEEKLKDEDIKEVENTEVKEVSPKVKNVVRESIKKEGHNIISQIICRSKKGPTSRKESLLGMIWRQAGDTMQN